MNRGPLINQAARSLFWAPVSSLAWGMRSAVLPTPQGSCWIERKSREGG